MPVTIYIISIAAAALMAYLGIVNQREVNRKRAAIDMLASLEADKEFQDAAEAFRDVRDGKGGLLAMSQLLERVTGGSEKALKSQQFLIDNYLNQCELLCIGIYYGAIDELIMFKWMRGSLVHDWHASKDYVYAIRESSGNDNIFEYLEKFGKAWNGPLDPKKIDGVEYKICFVTRKDNPYDLLNGKGKPDVTQGSFFRFRTRR
ncbi:protein of unknown function [Pseudidiomarina planktonica]|uniref:DUF4760 domain-containing protein n=1 Tax=Pseudidiomarina planktonica TaxID=1323738 RepID=A0A1Y6EDR4_9GAMM|nr:DUF4760 domain-containing protein [Pseudidiomarina planktonica]SMQ59311.1 protein of unknown function [Pseudidiomarina planktonica]